MPRPRKLEYFEDQLLTSPQGRKVLAVLHRHADEVLYLVQKNRPTMVCWQRHYGPQFIKSIVDSGFEEKKSYVKKVKDVTLEELALKMSEVLQDYGSVGLKKSIAQYGLYIIRSLKETDSLKQIINSIHQYELSY